MMAALETTIPEEGLTPGMRMAAQRAREVLTRTPGLHCASFPERLPGGMTPGRYLRKLGVGRESGEVALRAPTGELIRQVQRHAPWLASTSHGYLTVSDLHGWAEITFDPGLAWVVPVLEVFQDLVLVSDAAGAGIAMALDENVYSIYELTVEGADRVEGSGVVRVVPRPGPRVARGWAAPERARPRIRVSLWRGALLRLGASEQHLATFDRLAALQPPSDSRRSRRLKLRWSRLAQLWLAAAYPSFGAWLGRSGLVPMLSFEGTDLRRAELQSANLSRTDFSGASLSRACLTGADLSECLLVSTDLTEADLAGAKLRRANLTAADLWRSRLPEADLGGAILGQADLSEANLAKANLGGVMLDHADLSGANLAGASLQDAHLGSARLVRAILAGATLRRADLRKADLEGADLASADLSGANLSGAFYPAGEVPVGYSRGADECLHKVPPC
jgi:uncharacterized protein YjbI with pentapeptide repeats